MSYIGRGLDKISNIEKLDAITFDGSQSYSLTKSSVAFTPNSANSLIISINGVCQFGNVTVSGTSVDFGVAMPSTDTNDFILHLGVGVVNTPADATVTNAKLAQDIISGETELTAEPASTDELLLSDAGTLKRIDYSLISNTPSFLAYLGSTQNPSDATVTDVTMNTEAFDIGSCFNTGTYTFTPTTAGKYFLFTAIRAGSDTSRPAFIEIQARIRKNGGNCANQLLSSYSASNLDGFNANITTIVEANGSSDAFKVDFYGDVDAGTISLTSGQHQTYFGGYKLIGV